MDDNDNIGTLDSEINSLLQELEKDSSNNDIVNWIDGLDEDGIQKAFKTLNPYGVTIPSKHERTVSFSYTNYRLEFAKQFSTTALVAYLFNQVREWQVPDEVKPVDPEVYIRDPTVADVPADVKDEGYRRKLEQARASMPERAAAYRFLKHIFDFDPDKHAVSALSTNRGDPERRLMRTRAVKRALRNRNNIRNVPRQDYEADVGDLRVQPEGVIERETFNHIPSLDMFARLERYMEDHHEELLEVTRDIYGSRPDIDFSLNVYDIHSNKDEAETFKTKYSRQVIAPITNIQCNKWALLGPYRQNRERIDYMNSHTELLKAMLDKREQDSHIATDIMKKRIKVKKRENIREAGPDDPKFKEYLKGSKPEIHNLGATHVEADDETNYSSSDDEDDGKNIQVNMFTIGDGGSKLQKHKIYNPAEAPQPVDGADKKAIKKV